MIAGAADFGKTKEAGTWLEVSENKWIMLRISRGHDISGYFIFIPRQQKSLKRWCLISPKNTLLSEEAIKNKKKRKEKKKKIIVTQCWSKKLIYWRCCLYCWGLFVLWALINSFICFSQLRPKLTKVAEMSPCIPRFRTNHYVWSALCAALIPVTLTGRKLDSKS